MKYEQMSASNGSGEPGVEHVCRQGDEKLKRQWVVEKQGVKIRKATRERK